ncbi:MAG: serine hydrolase [Candidatus Promineifilaceae bacterium]
MNHKPRIFALTALLLLAGCATFSGVSPVSERDESPDLANPSTEIETTVPAYPAAPSPAPQRDSAYPAQEEKSVPPTAVAADPYPARDNETENNSLIASPGAGDLDGRFWVLQQADGPAGQTLLPEPAAAELNAVEFFPDGRVSIIAGCDTAGGSYEAANGTIEIETIQHGDLACPPGSLGASFRQWLGETATYAVEGGELTLALPQDAGTLTFTAPAAMSYGDELSRFFSYVVGSTAAGAQAASTPPRSVSELLDLSLQHLVYQDGDAPEIAIAEAPGAVVLVHSPQGSLVEASGLAALEQGRVMSALDRLEIGGGTMMFTGALLAQFFEEGLLTPDDTLAQWLPQLAEDIPYGKQMTVRQLATHTAGIADYAGLLYGADLADSEALRSAYTPEELVRIAIESADPSFPPGEPGRWSFSSTGYILLGMILETVSGQSYESLLQQRIFDPLEMGDTLLLSGVPEPGLVTEGYFAYPFDANMTEWNAAQAWSAGAIASTAADMGKFARALLTGALFQDPASLKLMTTFLPAGDYPEMAAAGAEGYGLGLTEFAPGLWGHRGQTAGFSSYVVVDPARDFILVALTNAANTAVPGDRQLIGRLLPFR